MDDHKKLTKAETEQAIHDAMLAVFRRTYTVEIEDFISWLAENDIVLVRDQSGDRKVLEDHILARHPKIVVAGKSMQDLQRLHARDHHFSSLSHIHWNGSDEDKNMGPGNRPAGWKTGLDVREKS